MHNISFNQDASCFAVGTDTGFVVYNCDPTTERFNRSSAEDHNGIKIVELLDRTNILALVGGGKSPKDQPNRLLIWNDFETRIIAELEFRSAITRVLLRDEIIFVALMNKSYVYKFNDLQLMKDFVTYTNPTGIGAISTAGDIIVAVPAETVGTICINNFTNRKNIDIKAHYNPIACIALSKRGEFVATASERGTLIRVWNTDTGEMIKELRRGTDIVTISCMAFNVANTQLVVCSDKETAHIFCLENDQNTNRRSNVNYYLGDYIGLPSYYKSEWSSVTLQVAPNSICAFSKEKENTVFFCNKHCGVFSKIKYDPQTGETTSSAVLINNI